MTDYPGELDKSNVRRYTNLLLKRVDDGRYNARDVLVSCVKDMSADAVQNMMELNEYCTADELDEEEKE